MSPRMNRAGKRAMIRQALAEKPRTQGELAKLLGVDPSTVSRTLVQMTGLQYQRVGGRRYYSLKDQGVGR